jgi:hypothetical protein
VDPEYLSSLGVKYYYFPDDLDSVNKIASERNYKNRDEIEISPELLPRAPARGRGNPLYPGWWRILRCQEQG